MKKSWTTVLKIGVTAVGLIIVLTQFDLSAIASTFRQTQLTWVLVGFGLLNLSLVVRAYRWWLLLQGLGSQVGLGRLVSLYFIGSFYNAFLPSGFGGDVVRVVEVSQDVATGVAAGTVLLDRLTGLLALFIMALCSLPFRPATFPNALLQPIVAICVLGLLAGFVVLQGQLALRLAHWLPDWLQKYTQRFLEPVLTAVHQCGWGSILAALGISFLFNLMMVGWWLTSARALHLALTLPYLLLTVPILSLLLLVPSVGGLGVRESLAPLLFNSAGLSNAQAASLAFLVFLLERASGLLGAGIYFYTLLRQRQNTPKRYF